MSSRTGAPGAVATEISEPRARSWPGDPENLAGALARLDAYRHDKLLEAVAIAAKELLRSSDLSVSLPKVIERIGQATGVDRVHILMIDPAAAGQGHIIQHHLWSASGISTPPFFKDAKNIAMVDVGLESWLRRLAAGKVVVGHVRDFEEPASKFFKSAGVKSAMAVPVFADGQLWGHIGLDDCRDEREWSPAEIDTLKTLAELIGATVARACFLMQLADASRIVENSPTLLYRLGPQPPFPLTFVSQNTKRYGYKAEELLTSSTRWQNLIKREDMPTVIANLKSVAEGKAEFIRAEFRFRKPDGSWAWFDDDGRALRDADGRLIAIEGILTDITERKAATHRRDVILEAVAASAKELLRSSDLQQSLPKVIEQIGQATGVDRAHIFEVDASTTAGRVLQHHMWSAPGVPTSPLLAAVKGAAMAEVGFEPWLPRLAKGETIVGHVRDFEPPVRDLFNQLGTQSVLTVPVRIDGQWWGQLGFDDCRTDREWSPTEVDTLETLAELVGAAVARNRQIKVLGDANRIIESSPTILYRLSPQKPFNLTYLSQNVRRYGYEADELLASPGAWLRLFDSEYHPTILADIKSIIEGKTEQTLNEFRLKKPDGTHAWLEGRGYAVRDEQRRLVAIEGILTDITDRKLAAEKIAALARTDSLTGLPNRAAFLDRLNLEFARAKRSGHQFAVHYLDLDHFKDVNDTLGHPVGDALLCAVAERLKDCVRETDMVARFGGDEFAVLQDDIAGAADIETLAAKIGAAVAAPFALEGNHVSTTASIGIVPYRSDVAGVDIMMMKADLALYRAKNEGRNQFRFHVAELDEQTRERMIIGEELRHAIARGEFELYYQPQVDLKSGWIVGLEALIRWNHPKRGLLLPAAFIPIAETTGSIVPIGEWVIEHACWQIKTWSDLGIAPPIIAVNLSGAQFKLASQLDQIVTENLTRYAVAPKQMELELTESVLIETTQRHGEAFERLRKIGVRLAIDDFGTGYSSLDYLRMFHVSRLKIDRRFIADITTSADDAAIVRATIGLAHELGIEVVAEGVETAGQRDFLIAAGCKVAQGYLFGMPMPAAAAGKLLRDTLQFAAV